MNKVAKKRRLIEAKLVAESAIITVSNPSKTLQHATNNCEWFKKSDNLVVAKNKYKSSNSDGETYSTSNHALFDFNVSGFLFISGKKSF